MKKLLCYIGLMVLIQNLTHLKAQVYHSVLENTSFVQLNDLNLFVNKKSGDYEDDPYYFDTEKVIDSMCFQDIKQYNGFSYKRYKANGYYIAPGGWGNGARDVYLRQNADNSKLYARFGFSDFYLNQETLIYDISLNIGDSFPTHIFYVKNYGWYWDELYLDTTLIVDSVYYVNGRKIVELNYYQKFGPFSQQYRFIEGIGPNYGIHPLNLELGDEPPIGNYSFACMIRVYKKDKMTYDFVKGALPFVNNNYYYSVFGNYSWGHYMAKGEVPMDEPDKDPYYTSIEKGPDSLVFVAQKEYKDYTAVELQSTLTGNSYFFSQISNCTQVFAKMEDELATDSILIYDISLNQGDMFNTTLYTCDTYHNWNWKDTTLVVDTVYFIKERKVVKFDYWQTFGPYSQFYMFLEGYGPTFGLFPFKQEFGYILGCLTYVSRKAEDYEFKKYVSIPQTDWAKSFIELYPNPAQDWLQIFKIGYNTGAKIAIYNIAGQCMLLQELQSKINISTLIPGIYVVSINTNNIIFNYKLIKQ